MPEINDSQQAVLDRLLADERHSFVCGQAGTGKSYLLREFVEQCELQVVVCAPTGLAANHVDGATIHSLFRLPLDPHFVGFSPSPHPEADKVLAKVDVVVVDEVSMVRADMLDAIDARLRLARESSEPFGGARMIFFGDLLQLPPVVVKDARERIFEHYPSEFFFDAEVMQNVRLQVLELTEIVRQEEVEFMRALGAARIGRIGPPELATLNTRVLPSTGAPFNAADLPKPVLATRNDVVRRHNDDGLAALPGKPVNFVREWRGRDGAEEPGDAPCERWISLKVGCPVLFTRNDPELGVSNGSTGEVVELDAETAVVEVDGEQIEVEQQPFVVKQYKLDRESGLVSLVELGEFLQLPLRLGFAITVHRAQGQTYETATIDFSQHGPFTPGHAYVAVSRVRRLEGLNLTRPLRPGDFRCSDRARAFLEHARGLTET